ncbi:hypothetical protein V8F20_004175 [Naviculisporaceae sp. PSN 640]
MSCSQNCTMATSTSREDSAIVLDPSDIPPPQAEHKPATKQKEGAYVRYRVEYRHRITDELLSHRETEGFHADEHDAALNHGLTEPAFEVITTFRTRVIESGSSGKGPGPGVPIGQQMVTIPLSSPRYHLNIFSPAIINALQSVVQYYPSQSLTGDPVVIQWPYAVLAHHYDELAKFRDDVSAKAPEDICILEKDAPEHLTLLLAFLDEHIMKEVREEQERNRRGAYTWELAWVSRKPGTTVMERWIGEKDWGVKVVYDIQGGVFDDPPTAWSMRGWAMRYDGRFLGRHLDWVTIGKFDGESSNDIYFIEPREIDDDDLGALPEAVQDQIGWGKTYWELLGKHCKHHKGESRDFPHNEIDALVMVDQKTWHADGNPPLRLLDSSDCRPTAADGTCAFCRSRKKNSDGESKLGVQPLFEDYNKLVPEDEDDLYSHIYLLCPVEMKAFVFKTRNWETVHVQNFSEPKFEESMIDGLVMDPARKNTIMSLAKSYARRDKRGQELKKSMWSADFIKNKGGGLIFLLHGRPGVGKTCTAECIAAFTRRPLMILTPSDIGTTPGDVEMNLTRMFKRAMSWEAVLLIDEADVFMERRTTADLDRNSLVAGFLRALENYDGILFLTTNRVGAFDDAFISRVHVQLYYPEFTDEQRTLVWKTFTDKLARERGDYIRLNIDAKEYIRGAEMRAVQWNGREIRNALQTAVALAEYDAEKDEEGKILVTDTHLKAVVELSRDFKDYLNQLHKGDESKRAERKYERLDGFSR